MPVLLIQNASGESEIRELSKHITLAIGRHASNDIRVAEPDVAVLHCRISWNSAAYEVVSGTPEGIEFNGELVPQAQFTVGDCLQVGSIALFYYERIEQAEAALRGETVEPDNQTLERERKVAIELKREALRQKPPQQDLSLTPVRRRIPPLPPHIVNPADPPEVSAEPPLAPQAVPAQRALAEGMFHPRPVRPGEQDLLRSPLVVTLGIGTVILVMMSLALWFVIGRDSSQKAYQQALTEMEQKRFALAITQFEEFLKTYPGHRYASAARHALDLSRVEQPIAGAAPDWERGLKALDDYLAQHRRDKDFAEFVPRVLDLAERIAKGAATSAGLLKKPALLITASNASRSLQQYSPSDKPPRQALADIDAAVQKAEAAIRKHDTFQRALAQIDKHLKARQPFAAFDARRKLLLKYPDLESDKSLQSRLQQALDAERKLTVRKVEDSAAQTSELVPPVNLPALNLIRHTRTRADSVASGTCVFTIAQDCCFAADTTTGVLQWRRVIGADSPFPPQPVALDVLALLLFDTRANELVLVRQRDGGLIWRQALAARATAAPFVHAGQIFIPTRDSKLYQLDAATGKLTAHLTFSQPLTTSPLLVSHGELLIVAGDQAVLYTLKYRPLECVAVTYTGHAPGAIQAPLVKMGDFLLTAENDRQDSALVRVWDTAQASQSLSRLAAARVQGQVREPAMLRGKTLVVPSSPERLSAFTVSDKKGEQALAAAGAYQAEHPQGGPIYVTLGPDDELWMTSSSLRRLQIGPDSLLPQKGELGLGISTQPVQVLDQVLFATSRVPSNTATYFMAADRQQMVTHWLSVLASRVLASATTPGTDGSLPILTDTGDVFSLTAGKLKAGGTDNRPTATLPLPSGLTSPLEATTLANGRLAAWCGGPQAKLWLLNADGIVGREIKLPERLEAPPLLLSGGVLLPLPGKLRLIETAEFKGTIEDLMPPADPQHPAHWKGILPLDEKQAIAVSDQGRVLRAQVRAEPVPHVAEVANLDLKAEVEQPPVLVADRLHLATGKLWRCLDVSTFESRGQTELPDVVSQGPWVVGDLIVMVCGRDQLVAIAANTVKIAWKQPTPPGGLGGAPQLRNGQLLSVSQTGEISCRNLTDGTVIRNLSTGLPVVLGPRSLQDLTFIAARDGTVLCLTPWLESQP